ncbi:DUF2064 domain-containing protein [Nocardioides sp.]|uniref:TIGR04282 family arsenosugar biosynthesis glycosyltransferase n=1 Tax=Nocardioides sp. TaxID=35761 RepID=UPI0035169BE7
MSAAIPLGTRILVMAKAPSPGRVKTRLAARIGPEAAAEVAAAALADTIAAAESAVGVEHCVLALGGGLDDAVSGTAALRAALVGWRVIPQRGDDLGERLLAAHTDVGPGPLVQVGMDTPQAAPSDLRAVAAALLTHDAVVAPAEDGGWWALGRHDPQHLRGLPEVRMSSPDTCADTVAALVAAGAGVHLTRELRDVDEAADADVVARLVPDSRFARAWRRARERGADLAGAPDPRPLHPGSRA